MRARATLLGLVAALLATLVTGDARGALKDPAYDARA